MITVADWLEGLIAARNVIGLRTNPLGPTAQQTVERPRRPNVFNTTTTRPSNAPEKCPCCDGRHDLPKCRQFQGLPVERRAEIAKLNARCFRCLETGHIGAGCSKRTVCGKDGCKAKHHYLLHAAPRIFPGIRNSTSSEPNEITHENNLGIQDEPTSFVGVTRPENNVTLLPIVPMIVSSSNGKRLETFGLLDKGSEVTMIDSEAAKKLGLEGKTSAMRFNTFHSHDPVINIKEVSFTVTALDGSATFALTDCYAVPKLELRRRNVDLKDLQQRLPHLTRFELTETRADRVSILIGSDNPLVHDVYEKRRNPLDKKAPEANLTPIVWCLVGPIRRLSSDGPQCHNVSAL